MNSGSKQTKEAVVEEFRIRSIHEAAMNVIARKGISQATMQAIADEAGIAKGTIYLYFQDRTALLESLADTTFSRLIAQVEPIWERSDPVASRLKDLVETQLQFFDENREFFRVFQTFASDPNMRCRREQNPHWSAYLGRLEAMLAEGMRKRELRKQNAERLAAFLADAFRFVLFRRITEGDDAPPVSDDVQMVVSTMLHGILTERKSR